MSVYDKCFIERGSSLVRLKTGYSYCFQDPGLACLLLDGFFRDAIDAAQSDWRAVVSYAVNSGVPTPCFSTALAFYDGYRSERLPANLIQVKKHFYLMTSISNRPKFSTCFEQFNSIFLGLEMAKILIIHIFPKTVVASIKDSHKFRQSINISNGTGFPSLKG